MKILLPTRAGGTRWLGHSLKALNVFLIGYPAIRMHLEQLAASNERGNSKTKAIGLLKLIKSRDIISMALFLQDILTVLQKVSMKFQEEGSVVADVSLTIKTALTCIKSFAGNNGPSFHKLSNYEIIEELVAGPTTREIYKLTGGNGELTVERQKLITKLYENLEVCFEDTTQGLIKCTSIANFRMWPDKEEELHGYGDDMIK